jgi:hypothetical protein
MLLSGIRIAATENTPEVILQPSGKIIISGRSMCKDAALFYKQMESWLDVYLKDPADITRVDIWLEYFDNINYSAFISVLRKIKSVNKESKQFIINWHYEEDDDDIMAQGENISSVLNIPVNLVMISEYNY